MNVLMQFHDETRNEQIAVAQRRSEKVYLSVFQAHSLLRSMYKWKLKLQQC